MRATINIMIEKWQTKGHSTPDNNDGTVAYVSTLAKSNKPQIYLEPNTLALMVKIETPTGDTITGLIDTGATISTIAQEPTKAYYPNNRKIMATTRP